MISFRIDKKSPVPFYRQIVDLVLGGISGGHIDPGDRLPTIRDLAVQLKINPNTVVKAYTQMQILGVVDTQQGCGVFVRPASSQAIDEDEKQRITEELCLDFVGRAQLLNINIDDLLACLRRMKSSPKKEQHR